VWVGLDIVASYPARGGAPGARRGAKLKTSDNVVPAVQGKGGVRARTLLVLLGLAAAALLLWRPGRGPQRTQVAVDGEISGRWTTVAPAYADRFLDIRPDRVVFGLGAEGEVSHPVIGVSLEPVEGGGRQYVIAYDGGDPNGTPLELRLSAAGGRLVLANLPDVAWTRSP